MRLIPGVTIPATFDHRLVVSIIQTWKKRRRDDDHLCLVAGSSKLEINELKAHGIATVQNLGGMALPLAWKPDCGSADSYIRIREQARIVVEARTAGVGS